MKKLLATGICVNPGFVKGKSRIIREADEVYGTEPGEILVLPESHPMFAIAVMSASAVICERGGKLSHICIVAMEMGIPCITQAEGALERIANGCQICLDASEGEVYTDE